MTAPRSENGWHLRARNKAARCALCHGAPGDGDWIVCEGCGTSGHSDCLCSEGLCPTLGCDLDHSSGGTSPPKTRGGGQVLGVSLEAMTLEGIERQRTAPRAVEQRIVKSWKIRKLLSHLQLSVDDIVNDRAAKRKVYTYFKIQRQSERLCDQRNNEVDDDYQQWIDDQV
jgi:hypothetical protein